MDSNKGKGLRKRFNETTRLIFKSQIIPMNMNLKSLSIKPKTLFLIDGIGAVVTALSLYVMKVALNEYFGMPPSLLTYLSAIAIVFGIYSFSCFILVQQNSKRFLKIIGYANLSYCCLTAFLVIDYYHHLTLLGVAYFLGEIAIICTLVFVELTFNEKD